MSIKNECLICLARRTTPQVSLYRDCYGYVYCEEHHAFATKAMMKFERSHPIKAPAHNSDINRYKPIIGFAKCGCGDCWFCILNGGWGEAWQRKAEARRVLLP